MRRLFLKYLLWLLGALLVTASTAIVGFALWFNPNQFKPLVIAKIQQLTGFKVAIPEAITWTLIPSLGLVINDIKILEPTKFAAATIKKLVVHIQLLPLLRQQLLLSTITLDKLQLGALACHNISSNLELSKSLVALQPLRAYCYQGALQSSIILQLTPGHNPILNLAGTFNNIDLNDLIAHLDHPNAITKLFRGKATITLHSLSSHGADRASFLKNLTGSANLTIKDGALKGVDFGLYMATAAALLHHQAPPQGQLAAETLFTKCTGSAIIKQGVIYNKDLVIVTPYYLGYGQGVINLAANTINYELRIYNNNGQLPPTPRNAPLPVLQITGSLDNFKISLANLASLENLGKTTLTATTAKIAKYLPQAARDFLTKLLH